MRVPKSERQENAKLFYHSIMDGYNTKGAITIRRTESKTNPNVHRCQFLAATSQYKGGKLVVIAESVNYGIEGCFSELINSIKGGIVQTTYWEDNFNDWLEKTLGLWIAYDDGNVILLERDTE